MYRAIKSINGGEEVEFRHFNSLDNAYHWLQPSAWRQMQDLWHLKMIHAVREFFEVNTQPMCVDMIGFDEMEKPMYLYIQRIESWNDALPQDL